MELNSQMNAAELEHHATDQFLNENAGHFLAGGRIRRDAYKGSTREDREKVKESLFAQADEQKAAKLLDAQDQKAFDREAEKTRKGLLAMERQKFRLKRQQMEQCAIDNKKVESDHQANLKAIEESYKN